MNKRPPIWLLPNLLSLDAPLVAVVWMWMITKSLRVQYIETTSYLVLAAAVWCVYVLDRIRDVKRGVHEVEGEMPWRHRFHWKYRKWLMGMVVLMGLFCAYASLFSLSRELLAVGLVGLILVFVYYLVSKYDRGDVAYVKNFVAGMTFAYGVAAPVVIYSQSMPMEIFDVVKPLLQGIEKGGAVEFLAGFFSMLVASVYFVVTTFVTVLGNTHLVLFGLLCVMNITAIDLWERSRRSDDLEVKQASEFSLSSGLIVLVAGSVFAVAYMVDDYGKALCYAVMVAAGLLQMINRYRYRFSLNALRVLVDLALIIPAPLALMIV